MKTSTCSLRVITALLFIGISSPIWSQTSVSFFPATVSGYTRHHPTSLQFGPDGRLYVATQSGYVEVLTVARNGIADYDIVAIETIELVRNIPNHNDNGSLHSTIGRQVTGILVTGTPSQPVIYVTSSDYRIGGKAGATDTNLDTNSGVLSRLTMTSPGNWTKIDLVRGLPRSEENHSPNGMALDASTNTLYVAQGGNANAGAPSNNFAFLCETALSAAILSIDLDALAAMPVQGSGAHPWIYDLPTLDDPDRPNLANGSEAGDPFGGNDGLNQAMLVPGGPVQIYAPGFRNAYDLVITKSGRMYAIDNGANPGWGGTPFWTNPSLPSTATNKYDPNEPGSTSPDVNGEVVSNIDFLHHIAGPGYYGGHPNPIRANPAGAGWYTFGTSGVWRTSTTSSFPLPSNWPPVPVGMANPIEGDFQSANPPKALWGWNSSTNGLTEYTATNFNGAMTGNLITVLFSGKMHRIVLSQDGTAASASTAIASNFGTTPLDVIAQGNNGPFPGTIWVACYGSNSIVAFEPTDYSGGSSPVCTGFYDPGIDEDGDGYNNADEIDSGSDPCNPADIPPDYDGDFLSDRLDDDDDSDGTPDLLDAFPLDFDNGGQEHLPITFEMLNGVPGYGFGGVGFTGWMLDYQSDYLDLFDEDQLIVGGASGIFTINNIDHGDAWLSQNNQRNAFQFGLNVDAQSGPFYLQTRLNATNLFQPNPQDYQSAGFYIGNGDQDNYLRISAIANGGQGGIEVFHEKAGAEVFRQVRAASEILSANEYIDLYLSIDPAVGGVQPSYSVDGGAVQTLTGIAVGEPILGLLRKAPDSSWSNALAVGIIATSNPRERAVPLVETKFTADWDFIYAFNHDEAILHKWSTLSTINTCEARSENGLAAIGGDIVLIGGRGLKPVELLDLETETWTDGVAPPIQLHHFQPVAFEGLVYVLGAFTGNSPTEPPVERIYVYDTLTNKWHAGPFIPTGRRRGSAGATLYNGKIYLAGGNTFGHGQGVETTVPWFDVYDPVTNTWTALPNAPHPRDHAQLAEAGGKLFLVGGRIGGTPGGTPPAFFSATVPEVDVYDPATNSWSTLSANLPTPRGGVAAARLGPRVVVAGGETAQAAAHKQVEAFHIHDQAWENLSPLIQGRHGTGMVSVHDTLYIVAGAGSRGGSTLLSSVEVFSDNSDFVNPMEPLAAGTLVFSENSLALGSVNAGENATKVLYIGNEGGNQAIIIENITLTGDSNFVLEQPYPMPFLLAPNHELALAVTFNASGSGSKSANVIVTHSGGLTQSVPVSGTVSGSSGGGGGIAIRINSGGPQYTDASGQVWSADSHFVGGKIYDAGTIAIANTNDPALFRTERYGTASFSYQVPVTSGTYDVHLHFAETHFGVRKGVGQDQTGSRVFSVSLEGVQVLANYDIWADVGPAAAVTKSFQNISVTDGKLSITVNPTVNNAKFSAIEIVSSGTTGPIGEGQLGANPAGIAFGKVAPGSTTNAILTLTNSGTADVTINQPSLTGSGAAAFAHNLSAGAVLNPGQSVAVTVQFTPPIAGSYSAVLAIPHSGVNDTLSVPLSGSAEAPVTLPSIRINSGGPQYTDSSGRVWSADSHFVGGKIYDAGTIAIANTNDPALFRTERYGDASFSYQVPVTSGTYDVHLHFAETHFGVRKGVGQNQTGSRVFSVSLEGVQVLANYDIWADVGPAAAVTKSFQNISVTDGKLSITVNPTVNNAKFSAIEVVPSGTTGPIGEGELAANPASLAFGKIAPGSSTNAPLTLTNSGTANLTISESNLIGGGAAAFSHNLSAGTVLTPGQSVAVTVQFAPQIAGSYTATLVVTHSGVNGTLSVPLSGSAEAPVTLPSVRINSGGPQYTDSFGQIWSADSHFVGGRIYDAGAIAIANTNDPALFRTERYGDASFSYQVPVTSGTYDVYLHFAETHFGVRKGIGQNQTGSRVFSVSIEGVQVLANYDIWADVGPAAAVTKSFQNITVSDGTLSITVNPTVNNAKFSAIEVVPSGTVTVN